MHSVQSVSETCGGNEAKSVNWKDGKGSLEPKNQGKPDTDELVEDLIGKSFEEEEESSVRSDDLSRSDAPSDDTFQTPSTSLQNLASGNELEPGETDKIEITEEIGRTSSVPDEEREEVILNPAKIISPQVSLVSNEEIKSRNESPLSQTESGNLSPAVSPPSIVSKSSDLTLSTESNISRDSNFSSSSGNNSNSSAGLITLNKELQPGTYNSKPGKKKMWYHVFTPSYKTRSNDFRKYFKDLPPDERLIVDYSCALQKEILAQGRMYISQSYLSFYANIFGWQTTITIKFKEISNVTKENTAVVIPNAIQISTATDKYFFTSFVNRDATYLMMFKLWQMALLEQNMTPKEIWKLVHVCYGEVEIGSEEEESTESYLSLSSTGSLLKAPSISTLHSVSDGDAGRSVILDRSTNQSQSHPPRSRSSSDLMSKTVLKKRRRSGNGEGSNSKSKSKESEVLRPAGIRLGNSIAELSQLKRSRIPLLSLPFTSKNYKAPFDSPEDGRAIENQRTSGSEPEEAQESSFGTKFEKLTLLGELSSEGPETGNGNKIPKIFVNGDPAINSIRNKVCSSPVDFAGEIISSGVLSAPGRVNGTEIVDVAPGNLNFSNGISNVDLIPMDLSDSSDSEEEAVVEIVPTCPAPHDDGKVVVDTVIPCDVNTLFTMLFTNSKFYLEFHTMRKTFDIIQEEWQDKQGKTMRQVSFTLTLNQRMGPKHSQITETQHLLPASKPGVFYAVDIESNNAGIPYADAFYVTCHFCLSRIAESESRLIIVAQIRYRKSIWGLTKNFIEKNSWAGLEEFYSSLEKCLKEECTEIAIAASPPPSPRTKPSSLVRRRPLRKKGPAPGIPTGVPAFTANVNPSTIPVSGDAGTPVEVIVPSTDNSFVLKVILSILATLLLLNAFLYYKLTKLEASSTTPLFFSSPSIIFNKETPTTHQEWLELLQKQEALHRFELQTWHDILLSALKILKHAETDLESLKLNVDSYSQNRIYDHPIHEKSGDVDPVSVPSGNADQKENQGILLETVTA